MKMVLGLRVGIGTRKYVRVRVPHQACRGMSTSHLHQVSLAVAWKERVVVLDDYNSAYFPCYDGCSNIRKLYLDNAVIGIPEWTALTVTALRFRLCRMCSR